MLANLRVAILDSLWPRTCSVEYCGKALGPGDGPFICPECFAALPRDEEGAFDETIFSYCAAFLYEGALPQLIKDFKFNNALYLTEDFAGEMALTVLRKFPDVVFDRIVPVPIHPMRWRQRGYNQSEELANAIGRMINVPVDTKALKRRRNNPHQSLSSRAARLKNLIDSFEVVEPKRLKDCTILLVDDVTTTGSTFTACVKALRTAHVRRICAVALARAVLD